MSFLATYDLKFYCSVFLLSFFLFQIASATEGCLVGNNFYTTYLGQVGFANNPEISGNKRVYNLNGTNYPINYSGTEVCNTVAANKYANGSPDRNGDLCFVMSSSTYNSYPLSGGIRISPNYPSANGSLQNFTVSCLITPVPFDDYLPIFILIVGGLGYFAIGKSSIFKY